ncbi:acyl-CoA dehydrogenase [Paraburkholderia sp. 2C]
MRFTTDAPQSRGAALEALCARGLDRLPLPGRGRTVERWSALAAVAACDLALVKLYEGHTDALAILAELRASGLAAPGQRWGVWAAEPPNRKVTAMTERHGTRGNTRNGALNDGPDNARTDVRDRPLENAGTGAALRLEGVKPWCSGAALLTHALVTVSHDGEPLLAAVELAQPSVHVSDGGWNAIGMAATGTSEVCFDGALAWQVGAAGAYLARPGFWHGGAGIAACWYGCAADIAAVLRAHVVRRQDPHACAHLGAADAQLAAAGALLRETAAWIDRYPRADAMRRVMRARLAVEEAATSVLAHATRALGPGPLCTDLHFARAAADLPVFLRQSHAERDAASLGEALRHASDRFALLDPLACEEPDAQWPLFRL